MAATVFMPQESNGKRHCGVSSKPLNLVYEGAINLPQDSGLNSGVTTSVQKCFYLEDTIYFQRTVITSLKAIKRP